jgi:hypothetical protein
VLGARGDLGGEAGDERLEMAASGLLAVARDLLEGGGQARHLELPGVELHLRGDDLGVHDGHPQSAS